MQYALSYHHHHQLTYDPPPPLAIDFVRLCQRTSQPEGGRKDAETFEDMKNV